MQWLTALSGNPRNRFVGFARGKHGTEMFDLHPELARQIVAWYVATLVKEPRSQTVFLSSRRRPLGNCGEP